MAEIKVTTEGMRNAANDFAAKMGEWEGLVNMIWIALAELDAMWDGDANESFNALIAEDKPKFEKLYAMMEVYKDAITVAAQKYEDGEIEIKNIVSTRIN